MFYQIFTQITPNKSAKFIKKSDQASSQEQTTSCSNIKRVHPFIYGLVLNKYVIYLL